MLQNELHLNGGHIQTFVHGCKNMSTCKMYQGNNEDVRQERRGGSLL